MENVLSVYSSKLLAAGITTDKHFYDDRKVLASKGEILQIFSNIITNAADAMRQGGVLSISIRPIVSSMRDGIQTIIRDNGNGIREEHLAQIFEPFFTTKGDLGTGIGLWVAKPLVEARGGKSLSRVAPKMEILVPPSQSSFHLPLPLVSNRHRKSCDSAAKLYEGESDRPLTIYVRTGLPEMRKMPDSDFDRILPATTPDPGLTSGANLRFKCRIV
jgi:hypothetical protein